jgi:DDE superfamily endonuclease
VGHPPGQSGEFVARREDRPEGHQRPYDERRPLVGIDEVPVQRVGEVRAPLPARYDSEYQRNGTADQFRVYQPRAGGRHVEVTQRRTARDFAELLRWLVEDIHEEAEKGVLGVGNLNTHTPAGLYEAFEPGRARRIASELERHYTPRHGSWLNGAEVELAALSRQCRGRRIGSTEELRRQVAAWEEERNERFVEVKWRFTTADARIRLHRLYPSIE